ncbi:MAG: hypothetical protein EBU90_01735 [Proteobacteria bacterium]|nr:hypothetical protein [Pseudomonadota bacterium]
MADEVKKENSAQRHPAVMVAIIGSSGRGKSMSARNLDPETTLVINSEIKPFPFSKKFKHIKTGFDEQGKSEVVSYLTQAKIDKNGIKTIFFDSLSLWAQTQEIYDRKAYKGFEIYGKLGEDYYELLDAMRKLKDVIIYVTCHVEMITDETEGVRDIKMSTEGKKFSGKLEAYFPIVLFATRGEEGADGRPTYLLKSYAKRTGAKVPPGLLTDDNDPSVDLIDIPNDCEWISKKIINYYDLPL